jgi:hypothetical protein
VAAGPTREVAAAAAASAAATDGAAHGPRGCPGIFKNLLSHLSRRCSSFRFAARPTSGVVAGGNDVPTPDTVGLPSFTGIAGCAVRVVQSVPRATVG